MNPKGAETEIFLRKQALPSKVKRNIKENIIIGQIPKDRDF